MTEANYETVWEVFVQLEGGSPHEHVGSVHATDKEMAIQAARDVYSRREKVANMWLVKAADIVATEPEDRPYLFEPGQEKAYRHPSFYKSPRGVKGL